MGLEQTPIRSIKVDYKCEECNKGYMRPTGLMLTSNPPKFPHKCNICDHEEIFYEKYPTIRYVLEGEILDLDNYEQQTC